jgi:ribosome biogenesis protein Nip4
MTTNNVHIKCNWCNLNNEQTFFFLRIKTIIGKFSIKYDASITHLL